VIPFITEAIWWRLGALRADRSIAGVLTLPPAKRLVLAPWPAAPARDDGVEHLFSRLQDVIGTIRNLRNEYKVDAKRVITVSLNTPDDTSAAAALANRELIELMAICTLKEVRPNLAPPENAAKAMINGCEVFIEGVIDPNAEANRLSKRREELTKQIATLEGRLASPAYTDKAPPHLVAQTRKQLEDAQSELQKLG
jgi:valyl-tRNA synthetase